MKPSLLISIVYRTNNIKMNLNKVSVRLWYDLVNDCENGSEKFIFIKADLLSASQDGLFYMYSRIPVSGTHGIG